MQRGRLWVVATALGLVCSLTVACRINPSTVVLKDVVVTYETSPSLGGPGVSFGPQKVRMLEIGPDRIIIHYGDGRGEFVTIDENLKSLQWMR